MPGEAAVPRSWTAEARALLLMAREVLQQFAVLIRNSYLHGPGNKVFDEPMAKFQTALQQILSQEHQFDLERIGSEFFANRIRMRMEIRNLHAYTYVADEMGKRGLGGFRFTAVPARPALSAFLSLLVRSPADTPGIVEKLNRALDTQRIAEIEVLAPRQEEEAKTEDRRQRAIQTYQQALDFIRDCMTKFESPSEINPGDAKRIVHKLVDMADDDGDGFSMLGLATIKDHDAYTFNHMVNVCVLAIAFGRRLGLRRNQLAQLGLCALYHDIGKLHIPLDVLNALGPLTEEQWACMGNHTVYAARTLFDVVDKDPSAVNRILTALQHHLQYDGNGYPKLQVLRRQGLFTRIIAIVDAFDAMTTKRIYQRQFLPDEALAKIYQSAGTRYDPLLVKAFFNCMGIFPVGSTVLLGTGELAVVFETNPDPGRLHQPKVKVVTDTNKRLLEEAFLAGLSSSGQENRGIVRCIDPEQFGINSAHYAI
ncbi:MAG: HD domain-containing phosphohydrolase [Acidobacteriota bacterium]